MKYLMIEAALLTLLASIDPAPALPPLREILDRTLQANNFCNRTQNVCSKILVREVIPEHSWEDLNVADTFCKAAAALKSVGTHKRDLNFTLERLAQTLEINRLMGNRTQPKQCEDVKVDVKVGAKIVLNKFLEMLIEFTQMLYRIASKNPSRK